MTTTISQSYECRLRRGVPTGGRSCNIVRFAVYAVLASMAMSAGASAQEPVRARQRVKRVNSPAEVTGDRSGARRNDQIRRADPDQVTSKPDEPPPLAIQGYDPVAYMLDGKALKGDSKFTWTDGAYTYYFASAEHQSEFEKNPEKFLPQYDGLCTTALGGSYGNRLLSDPTVFDVHEGKLYLFSSERAKRAYAERPIYFIRRANELFFGPALNGYCPVAYQERGEAIKGSSSYKHQFRGRVYRLRDEDSRIKFAMDTERYLPQYDGYCVEGVSRGKLYPADPKVFVVRDGKTYLFFGGNERLKFLMDPALMIQKADEQWKTLKDQVRK